MKLFIFAIFISLFPYCFAYSEPFDPHASDIFDISIDEGVESHFQEIEGLNDEIDLKEISEEGEDKYSQKYQTKRKFNPNVIKNRENLESTNMDSMSELSEEDKLRLQAAMDKKDKAEKTLSNTLKSFQNTQRDLISNVK